MTHAPCSARRWRPAESFIVWWLGESAIVTRRWSRPRGQHEHERDRHPKSGGSIAPGHLLESIRQGGEATGY
jgi:hypothetical protein